MPPDTFKFIQDISDSLVAIEEHLSDIPSYSDFSNSKKTIDAVERRLAIIGEALWKADKIDDALPITDKARIISLRHILVHDYYLIDKSIIWKIIEKNLPLLKLEINNILSNT